MFCQPGFPLSFTVISFLPKELEPNGSPAERTAMFLRIVQEVPGSTSAVAALLPFTESMGEYRN